MSERVYQMIRLGPGDYLLPSNDGLRLWRVHTYEEDGSAEGWKGTVWAASRYRRSVAQYFADDDETLLDWGNWEHWAGPLRTRREAIEEALR